MDGKEYSFQSMKKQYISPDFNYDKTKKIIYDKSGFPRSVVDVNHKIIKNNANIKRIFRFLIIFYSAIFFILAIYGFIFKFTPKKWSNPKWRPIIIYDLKFKTNTRYVQKSVKEMIDSLNSSAPNCVDDVSDLYQKFSDNNSPYNLYFKTPEKIAEILGEPDSPDFVLLQSEDRYTNYKAYYCYGEGDKAIWIVITYKYNYSVNIEFRNK